VHLISDSYNGTFYAKLAILHQVTTQLNTLTRMGDTLTFRTLFAALLISTTLTSACSTMNNTTGHSSADRQLAGPAVYVDAARLPAEREKACTAIAADRITDATQAAFAAGMLAAEFRALRDAAASQRVIASFRDSNQACLPHLAAGVQSKPHAVLQKTWDKRNLLPTDEHLAGLVSNLMKKPPKDSKVANPQLTLYNGAPVTCDYDLMDLTEADGSRIPGESPREIAVRAAFNNAIPVTPQGHRDRIMHGSQAGYRQYINQHGDEEVIAVLFKPEAPLTAFTADGSGYRLGTLEEVINFYHCFGIALPQEWDVETKGSPASPAEHIRVH
jgi:hypothetical protein